MVCGIVMSDDDQSRAVTRIVIRGWQQAKFVTAFRESGISIGDFSRLAGVTASTVYGWLDGRSVPQVDNLSRAVKILKLKISDVVVTDPAERYISDLRVLAGLTQPQLGKATGISTTTVTRIERGEMQLSDSHAAKLAEHLRVPVEEVRAAHARVRDRPLGTPA